MATKYVSDTKAGKSLSAYVILDKRGKHVATVKAHWSDGGTCLVNVHDNKAGFQHAKAAGYGYDKFTSALSGMTIDGHMMTNHCGERLKFPKGLKYFPANFKSPKGYTLANYAAFSKATGKPMHSYDWRDKAKEELGIESPLSDEQWSMVAERADEIEKAWRESEDCGLGYSSCHRDSGLKYLQAIGYRVIQAL